MRRPRMLWLTSTLSTFVEAHLEGPSLDKTGLVDDPHIGDIRFGGPAVEPGRRRPVQGHKPGDRRKGQANRHQRVGGDHAQQHQKHNRHDPRRDCRQKEHPVRIRRIQHPLAGLQDLVDITRHRAYPELTSYHSNLRHFGPKTKLLACSEPIERSFVREAAMLEAACRVELSIRPEHEAQWRIVAFKTTASTLRSRLRSISRACRRDSASMSLACMARSSACPEPINCELLLLFWPVCPVADTPLIMMRLGDTRHMLRRPRLPSDWRWGR